MSEMRTAREQEAFALLFGAAAGALPRRRVSRISGSRSVRSGASIASRQQTNRPKEDTTMARTITRKAASSKAAPKKAAAAKSTSERRTHYDLLKLVPDIVKLRKAGSSWDAIQASHGVNAVVARKLLAEKGFNPKGESTEIPKITGSGAALAKKVAKARSEGIAFYTLALATGKTDAELKALLEEHGFAEATGRTYRKGEAAPKKTPAAKAKSRTAAKKVVKKGDPS